MGSAHLLGVEEQAVLPDKVKVGTKLGLSLVSLRFDILGHGREVHRFCNDCEWSACLAWTSTPVIDPELTVKVVWGLPLRHRFVESARVGLWHL